jgi:glycosyltransferase involved in cell wall biosynthesis
VRILYLADIRFPLERANGIQTAQTCHALAMRGHEVTLLVRQDTLRPPRDPLAFYALEPCHALDIVRLEVYGSAWRRRTRYLSEALRAVLRRDRHDVAFTRDLGVAGLALRIPRRLRLPIIYEAHGMAAVVAGGLASLLTEARSASRWKRRRLARREQRVWKRAEAYVTITTRLRRDLEAAFGTRHQCYVIPDGVRLPSPRKYGGPTWHSTPVVGYAGHLYPWKGVDTLLHAIALIPNVRALIVGGHPGEADLVRLQALARELRIESRVTFTGLVPPGEVPHCLARADVLVLPNTRTTVSASYTSPLKLFEYLAAGRPIVASDLPALREILTEGVTALMADPDSPASFAGAIERLIADRRLAESLARRAFEAATTYSWEERARRLGEALAGATGLEGRPNPVR